MDSKYKQLLSKYEQLKQDLDFYKQIHDYPLAMVYQMRVKTQQGKKVWVNTHTSSLEFLESLDKDEEIETLIQAHKSIQFKDRTL